MKTLSLLFVILDVAKVRAILLRKVRSRVSAPCPGAACSKLGGNPSSLGMRTKEPNG